MRVPRVHHPEIGGDRLTLSRDESEHVVRVLRLRDGDAVRVFDGAGAEREAVVTASDRRAAELALGEAVTHAVEPSLAVTLFQAACRADRWEWVLQKGTELGVAAFVPVVAERSGRFDATASRVARWGRIVLEAAKQSTRRVVPRILDPVVLDASGAGADLGVPRAPAGDAAVVLDPGAPDSGRAPEARSGVSIAVGPEGGWTEAELAGWSAAGWHRAGLGPRVLRTETAGIVAATLWLAAAGECGSAAGTGPV